MSPWGDVTKARRLPDAHVSEARRSAEARTVSERLPVMEGRSAQPSGYVRKVWSSPGAGISTIGSSRSSNSVRNAFDITACIAYIATM